LQQNLPPAAAHGAGISIFKAHGSGASSLQASERTNEDKQANPYSKHSSWKKNEHFSDVDIQ
jgi:hypothetical protein